MLQPKRVKFRKSHRGRMKGKAQAGNDFLMGEYALQALDPVWMTARQIEAARRAIVHSLKRGGNVWIRVFPDHPVTQKPAETRQGGGKGAVDHWIAVVKPGKFLFEIGGVDESVARQAFKLAAAKLPINARFVANEMRLRSAAPQESGAGSVESK